MLAELERVNDAFGRFSPGEGPVLAVLVLVLTYIIVDDLMNYRVRNDAIMVLLCMFVVLCVVKGSVGFAYSHFFFGTVLFLVLLVMYRAGLMGGGDVKLLAVAFLWLGLEQSFFFSLAMSAFGLVYSLGARLELVPGKWVNGRMKVPFAPSIALAWIVTLFTPSVRWTAFVG